MTVTDIPTPLVDASEALRVRDPEAGQLLAPMTVGDRWAQVALLAQQLPLAQED